MYDAKDGVIMNCTVDECNPRKRISDRDRRCRGGVVLVIEPLRELDDRVRILRSIGIELRPDNLQDVFQVRKSGNPDLRETIAKCGRKFLLAVVTAGVHGSEELKF